MALKWRVFAAAEFYGCIHRLYIPLAIDMKIAAWTFCPIYLWLMMTDSLLNGLFTLRLHVKVFRNLENICVNKIDGTTSSKRNRCKVRSFSHSGNTQQLRQIWIIHFARTWTWNVKTSRIAKLHVLFSDRLKRKSSLVLYYYCMRDCLWMHDAWSTNSPSLVIVSSTTSCSPWPCLPIGACKRRKTMHAASCKTRPRCENTNWSRHSSQPEKHQPVTAVMAMLGLLDETALSTF